MTTTPFHDPHAEPVQPIHIDLDGRILDPFAILKLDEVHEIMARPEQLARGSRSDGAHDRLSRLALLAAREGHRPEEIR